MAGFWPYFLLVIGVLFVRFLLDNYSFYNIIIKLKLAWNFPADFFWVHEE